GNQKDFREPGEQVFLDDVNFQLSKPGAEIYVPFVGQSLSAKHDNDVVVKSTLHFVKSRVVDVLAQIKADLRSAALCALPYRWPHRTLLCPGAFRAQWHRPESLMRLLVLKPYEVRCPERGFVRSKQSMARILLTEPDRAIREFIAGIPTEFGH